MSDELKAKGNQAFAAKNYKEAIEFFTQAIEVDPKNHVLFSNRSAAYSSLHSYGEALTDAETAISIKPDWAKAYGRKGAALQGSGRIEEARKAYEQGLALEPDNAQLKKGLDACKGSPVDSLVDMLMKNPKMVEYLQDPVFAAKIKNAKQNPNMMQELFNDPRIMEMFTSIIQDQGMNEMPKEEPKQEVKSEPKDVKMEEPREDSQRSKSDDEKVLGNKEYLSRNFEVALEHYSKALELDPSNIAVMNNIAAVYFEQGNYEECRKMCEDAVEKGRDLRSDYKIIAKALGRIGTVHMKQNDLESAIKYFEKSLTEQRTPDILAKLKEAEKLLSEQRKQEYHNPELAEMERNEGNELFKKGDFANAVKKYTEAIKRDENDPRAYSNRSACYAKLSAFNESYKDAETCIKLDPNFIKAYIRKASIEFLKREYEKCIETCNLALTMDKEGKHHKEIQNQIYKANAAMNSAPVAGTASMDDPEVQQILGDPVMQSILQQMQSDPKAVQEHMKNPMIAQKIRKLVQAGVVQTRSA